MKRALIIKRARGQRVIRWAGAFLALCCVGGVVGCGSNGGGTGANQLTFPGRAEFTILPDVQTGATHYYSGSQEITAVGAAKFTRSDLLIYGQTLFAAFDPGSQTVSPASVSGAGRYSIGVKKQGNGNLTFTVSDGLNQDTVVAVVTVATQQTSSAQVLPTVTGKLPQPVDESVAEAIALVVNSR